MLSKQAISNSHNQDFISDAAWNIIFGERESWTAAFSFRCWKADVSYSMVNLLKRLIVW